MSTRKDQLLRRMSGKKGRAVALTREEKALRDVAEKLEEMGGGGADWNAAEGEPGHVKNRTHYEETVEVGGDTLTWDGNTEGLVSVADMLYKISDNVLTLEDVKDGITVGFSDKTSESYTYEDISQVYTEYGIVAAGGIYNIPSANFELMGMVFPEAGIYVMNAASATAYTESITIPGYTGFKTTTTTVKTIDPKFLPDIGGTSIDVTAEVGQTIVVEEIDGFGKPTKWKAADYQPRTHWDEETVILPETTVEDAGDGQFPVSESAIPVVAGEEYVVNFNGTEYTVECVDMSDLVGVAGAKAFHLGSMELPPPEGEPPFGIMVMENVPDMGTMTLVSTTSEYEGTSITIGVKQVVAQKIPRQYLPNSAFYLKIRSTETGYAIIGTPNEIDDALNSDSNVILRWIWSDTADMFLPFACREVFSDGRRFYTFYGFCALTNNYQGLRFIETAEGSNELEYYVEGET